MMRQLWHDILTHRLATSLFALCWVGAWVITAVMWIQGAPVGLPSGFMLFVVIASVMAGWWRMPATTHWNQAHIIDGMRHGLIVAVLLMWLNLATQEILSSSFVPMIESPSGRIMTWSGWVMALLFVALILGILASVTGMIGGLIGSSLAYVFRRWCHRGEPPAPANVS
jgi:hypothetical protein